MNEEREEALKPKRSIDPKSGAAETIRDIADDYSVQAIVEFLMIVCEERQKRFKPPYAAESAHNKSRIKQWEFARNGARGLGVCLQYMLENGPDSAPVTF